MISIDLAYLPLEPSEVPCQKQFDIDGTVYMFEFRYNARYDFYTVYVYDAEYVLLFSTKVVYFNNLITAIVEGLFTQPIRAFDRGDYLTEAIAGSSVTDANLDNSVRLYLTDV